VAGVRGVLGEEACVAPLAAGMLLPTENANAYALEMWAEKAGWLRLPARDLGQQFIQRQVCK
jgi:hypothetical protein